MELLSEAKAEIMFEEKDMDDVCKMIFIILIFCF